MTNAQKLRRILQIVEDQIALEAHQIRVRATFDEIQFGRADAYSHIVEIITGKKAAAG